MADKYDTTENSEHGAMDSKDSDRCKHKTSRKVMIVAGLAAIIGTAAFIGAAQSSGWGDHGYGQGHGHGGYSHMQQMFEEFDSDGDGKLTTAEINAARMSRFNGADDNKDAVLSLDEFQDLWVEHMRPRMVDRFQMMDDDGDARVTEEEFAMPFRMIMRHMDRNDDGVFELNEMRGMRRGGGDCPYVDDMKRDDDKD